MKKRIISIAVSLCTVLSLFPVSAHAEEMNTPEPLYSNVGESVSGNQSIGNSAQNTASQENNTLTAVEKVQAMLNTLPTVESLEGADDVTVNAAYEAAQNVYDAIEELEAEEIALLTGMEKLSALMDWFNGQVMALEGKVTVITEDALRAAVETNGAVITLGNDIDLTNPLEINYDNPTPDFSTKIITNNHKLTGTIKLNGCALTVDGTLDADVEANYKEYSENNVVWWSGATRLYGGTYNGNITLNNSEIYSGTYKGQITGNGRIENGTFNNTVTCNEVYKGIFNSTVTCNRVHNGIFNNTVTCKEVYDGVFNDTCIVPEGNNNRIEIGIFYSVPNYTYKEFLPDADEHSYYITYKNGDNTYATEYLNYYSSSFNKTRNTLTNPTKDNYTFEGWYKDSDYTSAFDKNSLSTNDFTNGNLTLYAKWKHNDNAHVDENGDRKCDICNTQITGSWFISGDSITIYSGTDFSDTSVLTDITKIINHGTFMGICPETITKIINYGIIESEFPSSTIIVENKENGIIDSGFFGGGVTNDGTIKAGRFGEIVTNNGTIEKGDFEKDVTNNGIIKGGSFGETVTNKGTISGGTFNGTVNNSGTVSGGDFVNAKSTTGIYTVTFDSKGGSDVKTQWRAKAPATKPKDPTYDGKTLTFCGWVIKNNDDSYSLYNFSANVTENITLYANWDCELTGHTDVNPKDHNCDVCGSSLACEDVSPRDHKCDICNITLTTCSGGDAATCSQKSICDYCGKEYGSLNSNNHKGGTEIKNTKAATCTEDGYTGDTCCKDCGTKLQDGKPITKTGHTDANKDHVCDVETCKATVGTCEDANKNHKCDYGCGKTFGVCEGGTATCKNKAVCTYCKKSYGEVDKNNHVGETEIRNTKAADCTLEGYTGDTYCKNCNEKISSGTSVAAKGHTDANKDHVCDVETCKAIIGSCSGGTATCIKKSICIYCGKEYGSLDENNHTLKHYQKNAPTEDATGNKEYWQCTGCGKLFSDENGTNATKQEDITIKKLPKMLNGMGQSINAGESKELTFRSNAEIGDFVRVELDGNTVDAKNYTVKVGSTIVTLNAEYVASLPKGNHTISIVSTNGTASTTFALLEESPAANTPNEPENPSNNTPANPSSNEEANTPANEEVVTTATQKASPATGDDSHVGLWMAIMIVGAFLIRNAECGIRNKH